MSEKDWILSTIVTIPKTKISYAVKQVPGGVQLVNADNGRTIALTAWAYNLWLDLVGAIVTAPLEWDDSDLDTRGALYGIPLV